MNIRSIKTALKMLPMKRHKFVILMLLAINLLLSSLLQKHKIAVTSHMMYVII